MIATIHQPDFIPWYGFFYKLSRSDTWVVLDHTENNPRDAAFWCRRVKLLVNGVEKWISITLEKPEGNTVSCPINEMKVNLSQLKQYGKTLRTIEMAYRKTPYFDRYYYILHDYFTCDDSYVVRRNMRAIQELLGILNIETKIVFSSSLALKTNGTQLLVDILKCIDADIYLCGNGAGGYQDDALFGINGIELLYNRFSHPTYKQLNSESFSSGLSIMDALFNVGEEEVIGWMKG